MPIYPAMLKIVPRQADVSCKQVASFFTAVGTACCAYASLEYDVRETKSKQHRRSLDVAVSITVVLEKQWGDSETNRLERWWTLSCPG